MLYVRFPLSLRNVEDLPPERGIDVSHEAVRFWCSRLGPVFTTEIRRKRTERLRAWPQWRGHLDEVFVEIKGQTHELWRAVDHEGEVLEAFVTRRRDKTAGLKLLRKALKRYGQPKTIVTDRLRSYRSAMKVIGNAAAQACGRWLNNRAENAHQPVRRRERAMAKSRDVRTFRSSPPSTPPSQTTSTRTAVSAAAPSSRTTCALPWRSGGSSLQLDRRVMPGFADPLGFL